MIKSKKIPIICMLIIMLALVFVGSTGAWFTNSQIRVTNTQTANVGVQIFYGQSAIGSNSISLASPQNISIKNTSNIDVYVRAKLILNCVDSSGRILTDLDAGDYASITTSNFAVVSGYDGNFVYYYDTTEEEFLYLSPNASVTIVSAANITDGRGETKPNGVDVRLSIFAEAIQKDGTDFGLSKWEVTA